MHPRQYYFLAVILAAAEITAAIPLNINLGAYSPALVVGDGEISFGGKGDVSQLMNTLEGAAVNAASGAAAGAETTVTKPTAVASAAATKKTVAADDESKLKETAVDIVNTLGNSHASLQEGNRVVRKKRDLAGFDRALRFAEAALNKGPKVQLGTGGEGSGVGIIVDPAAGIVGSAAKAAKRDISEGGNKRRSVTTVYVKGGLEGLEKREVAAEGLEQRDVVEGMGATTTTESVSTTEGIDAVNVNLDSRDGLTLTFVEEVEE